jgi:hypothetical protein
MVPSAPVTPEVVETPVVAAPVAAEPAVPSAEVAVTAQAEAVQCLITSADAVGPEAIALVAFAVLGVVFKLLRSRSKKA